MDVLEFTLLSSSVCASAALMRMWAEVNRELPKERRIGLIGDQFRMWREHLRIFPQSGLRLFAIFAVVTFATAAVFLEMKKSSQSPQPTHLMGG